MAYKDAESKDSIQDFGNEAKPITDDIARDDILAKELTTEDVNDKPIADDILAKELTKEDVYDKPITDDIARDDILGKELTKEDVDDKPIADDILAKELTTEDVDDNQIVDDMAYKDAESKDSIQDLGNEAKPITDDIARDDILAKELTKEDVDDKPIADDFATDNILAKELTNEDVDDKPVITDVMADKDLESEAKEPIPISDDIAKDGIEAKEISVDDIDDKPVFDDITYKNAQSKDSIHDLANEPKPIIDDFAKDGSKAKEITDDTLKDDIDGEPIVSYDIENNDVDENTLQWMEPQDFSDQFGKKHIPSIVLRNINSEDFLVTPRSLIESTLDNQSSLDQIMKEKDANETLRQQESLVPTLDDQNLTLVSKDKEIKKTDDLNNLDKKDSIKQDIEKVEELDIESETLIKDFNEDINEPPKELKATFDGITKDDPEPEIIKNITKVDSDVKPIVNNMADKESEYRPSIEDLAKEPKPISDDIVKDGIEAKESYIDITKDEIDVELIFYDDDINAEDGIETNETIEDITKDDSNVKSIVNIMTDKDSECRPSIEDLAKEPKPILDDIAKDGIEAKESNIDITKDEIDVELIFDEDDIESKETIEEITKDDVEGESNVDDVANKNPLSRYSFVDFSNKESLAESITDDVAKDEIETKDKVKDFTKDDSDGQLIVNDIPNKDAESKESIQDLAKEPKPISDFFGKVGFEAKEIPEDTSNYDIDGKQIVDNMADKDPETKDSIRNLPNETKPIIDDITKDSSKSKIIEDTRKVDSDSKPIVNNMIDKDSESMPSIGDLTKEPKPISNDIAKNEIEAKEMIKDITKDDSDGQLDLEAKDAIQDLTKEPKLISDDIGKDGSLAKETQKDIINDNIDGKAAVDDIPNQDSELSHSFHDFSNEAQPIYDDIAKYGLEVKEIAEDTIEKDKEIEPIIDDNINKDSGEIMDNLIIPPSTVKDGETKNVDTFNKDESLGKDYLNEINEPKLSYSDNSKDIMNSERLFHQISKELNNGLISEGVDNFEKDKIPDRQQELKPYPISENLSKENIISEPISEGLVKEKSNADSIVDDLPKNIFFDDTKFEDDILKPEKLSKYDKSIIPSNKDLNLKGSKSLKIEKEDEEKDEQSKSESDNTLLATKSAGKEIPKDKPKEIKHHFKSMIEPKRLSRISWTEIVELDAGNQDDFDGNVYEGAEENNEEILELNNDELLGNNEEKPPANSQKLTTDENHLMNYSPEPSLNRAVEGKEPGSELIGVNDADQSEQIQVIPAGIKAVYEKTNAYTHDDNDEKLVNSTDLEDFFEDYSPELNIQESDQVVIMVEFPKFLDSNEDLEQNKQLPENNQLQVLTQIAKMHSVEVSDFKSISSFYDKVLHENMPTSGSIEEYSIEDIVIEDESYHKLSNVPLIQSALSTEVTLVTNDKESVAAAMQLESILKNEDVDIDTNHQPSQVVIFNEKISIDSGVKKQEKLFDGQLEIEDIDDEEYKLIDRQTTSDLSNEVEIRSQDDKMPEELKITEEIPIMLNDESSLFINHEMEERKLNTAEIPRSIDATNIDVNKVDDLGKSDNKVKSMDISNEEIKERKIKTEEISPSSDMSNLRVSTNDRYSTHSHTESIKPELLQSINSTDISKEQQLTQNESLPLRAIPETDVRDLTTEMDLMKRISRTSFELNLGRDASRHDASSKITSKYKNDSLFDLLHSELKDEIPSEKIEINEKDNVNKSEELIRRISKTSLEFESKELIPESVIKKTSKKSFVDHKKVDTKPKLLTKTSIDLAPNDSVRKRSSKDDKVSKGSDGSDKKIIDLNIKPDKKLSASSKQSSIKDTISDKKSLDNSAKLSVKKVSGSSKKSSSSSSKLEKFVKKISSPFSKESSSSKKSAVDKKPENDLKSPSKSDKKPFKIPNQSIEVEEIVTDEERAQSFAISQEENREWIETPTDVTMFSENSHEMKSQKEIPLQDSLDKDLSKDYVSENSLKVNYPSLNAKMKVTSSEFITNKTDNLQTQSSMEYINSLSKSSNLDLKKNKVNRDEKHKLAAVKLQPDILEVLSEQQDFLKIKFPNNKVNKLQEVEPFVKDNQTKIVDFKKASTVVDVSENVSSPQKISLEEKQMDFNEVEIDNSSFENKDINLENQSIPLNLKNKLTDNEVDYSTKNEKNMPDKLLTSQNEIETDKIENLGIGTKLITKDENITEFKVNGNLENDKKKEIEVDNFLERNKNVEVQVSKSMDESKQKSNENKQSDKIDRATTEEIMEELQKDEEIQTNEESRYKSVEIDDSLSSEQFAEKPILTYKNETHFDSSIPLEVKKQDQTDKVEIFKSLSDRNKQYKIVKSYNANFEYLTRARGKNNKSFLKTIKSDRKKSPDRLSGTSSKALSNIGDDQSDRSRGNFSDHLKSIIPTIKKFPSKNSDPVRYNEKKQWPNLSTSESCGVQLPYGYYKKDKRITNDANYVPRWLKYEKSEEFIIPQDGIFGRDVREPNFLNFCCNKCQRWINMGNRQQHFNNCAKNNNQSVNIKKPLNNDDFQQSSNPSATEFNEANNKEPDRPRRIKKMPGIICYVCGQRFTKFSIKNHEKVCLMKWTEVNKKKSRKIKPIPEKPIVSSDDLQKMLDKAKKSGNLQITEEDILNETYYNASIFNSKIFDDL